MSSQTEKRREAIELLAKRIMTYENIPYEKARKKAIKIAYNTDKRS